MSLSPTAYAKDFDDPIFGIRIDTKKDHFLLADAKLFSRCTYALDKVPYWVFGEYESAGVTYMILGGVIQVPPDGVKGPLQPFYQGVALRIDSKGCEGGDPETVLFGKRVHGVEGEDVAPHMVDWQIDPTALTGLSKDVVHRYTEAFGSINAFHRAIIDAQYPLNSETPAVLKQQLSDVGIDK